jgi:hypothetical protein
MWLIGWAIKQPGRLGFSHFSFFRSVLSESTQANSAMIVWSSGSWSFRGWTSNRNTSVRVSKFGLKLARHSQSKSAARQAQLRVTTASGSFAHSRSSQESLFVSKDNGDRLSCRELQRSSESLFEGWPGCDIERRQAYNLSTTGLRFGDLSK